jgi:hypothetical protein
MVVDDAEEVSMKEGGDRKSIGRILLKVGSDESLSVFLEVDLTLSSFSTGRQHHSGSERRTAIDCKYPKFHFDFFLYTSKRFNSTLASSETFSCSNSASGY